MFYKDYFMDRPNDPKSKIDIFKFLERPDNIARMIYFSERGLPALTGVVAELEKQFSTCPDFPLTDYRNRQSVGRMIKNILWHFGYEPHSKNLERATHLRDFAGSNLFSTSAIYKKLHEPAHGLDIQIV